MLEGSGTSRAPRAATFEELSSGERFTVSVNRLDFEGWVSAFGIDVGTSDSAGNEARPQAATALDARLDTSGSELFFDIKADAGSVRHDNTDFNPQDQFDEPYCTERFRASDHDPLVIWLDLGTGLAVA